MAEQQAFTPRKKIALDNNKLNLSAPSSGGGGKTASLIWGFHKNNPRITVWTRDPQDETEKNGKGKIQAELDLPVLLSMLNVLRAAIMEEPGYKAKLENKNFTFFGGKRSDAPMVLTEIWVGKDSEGFVFISVTAPGRPVIKFRIQPSDFHTWYSANGEKITPEKLATTYVAGYLDIVQGIYNHLSVTEYVDRAAEQAARQAGGGFNRGGGGGGGFNRGGNGGGGGYGGGNQGGGNQGGGNQGGNQGGGDAKLDDFPF